MTVAAQNTAALKRTPLHSLHVELGARMVPFAGYEMPVQYAAGVLKEHLHVRSAAGLFDVSHMGQLAVRARDGSVAHAASALEEVVPVDLLGLAPGRQRYALLTNEGGGIRDDLMITRLDDRLLIVANAACKDADEAYLRDSMLKPRQDVAAGFEPIMPSYAGILTDGEIISLTAYIRSLSGKEENRQ